MSTFHLIAPSGYCINQQAAASAIKQLEQQGASCLQSAGDYPPLRAVCR